MHTLEHISVVTSLVHEGLEAWARGLLRDANIETTEVYGSFPPEGTIASHLVLFPYRVGPSENQINQPDQLESLVGPRARNLAPTGGVPPMWLEIGQAITKMIMERYPRAGPRGRQMEVPHPSPPLEDLPEPMRDWYEKQEVGQWVSVRDGKKHALLPSLAWQPAITLRLQYLVVVGEGARGTADRATSTAPIAVQTLSVLAAGLQMRRQISVRVPPAPYDKDIVAFTKAMAKTLGGDDAERLKSAVQDLGRKADVTVTLLPGSNLTNADFTGLMQAMQRPLQPTLHLGVQMALGGGAVFATGASADIPSPGRI